MNRIMFVLYHTIGFLLRSPLLFSTNVKRCILKDSQELLNNLHRQESGVLAGPIHTFPASLFLQGTFLHLLHPFLVLLLHAAFSLRLLFLTSLCLLLLLGRASRLLLAPQPLQPTITRVSVFTMRQSHSLIHIHT